MNDVHAGDRALKPVLNAIAAAYAAMTKRTQERLKAFLTPHMDALQPVQIEHKAAYHRRLRLAFTGAKWASVRALIAADCLSVYEAMTNRVNDALKQAFTDGLNETAYLLSLTGADAWPITEAIVATLAATGVVNFAKQKIKKDAAIHYNEQRVQSAISGAIARNVKVDGMAKDVAKHFSNARRNEAIAQARSAIYGASDYGSYMAGMEAEKAGAAIEKTWLAIIDMHVRPSHSHLHMTTIPLNEVFRGYHGTLKYPHDPNADPRERLRCRCRMVVHLAGHAPNARRRSLLPTETYAYRRWRDAQIRKAGGEMELAKLHKQNMR